MIKRLALLLLICAAPAMGATYYVSSSLGSDANNGTSKATPWAHLPGMVGWTGTYTCAAGDQFVLYGGDTWTPTSTGNWTYCDGTSGSHIAVGGLDTTWFNATVCATIGAVNTDADMKFNVETGGTGKGNDADGSNVELASPTAIGFTPQMVGTSGWTLNGAGNYTIQSLAFGISAVHAKVTPDPGNMSGVTMANTTGYYCRPRIDGNYTLMTSCTTQSAANCAMYNFGAKSFIEWDNMDETRFLIPNANTISGQSYTVGPITFVNGSANGFAVAAKNNYFHDAAMSTGQSWASYGGYIALTGTLATGNTCTDLNSMNNAVGGLCYGGGTTSTPATVSGNICYWVADCFGGQASGQVVSHNAMYQMVNAQTGLHTFAVTNVSVSSGTVTFTGTNNGLATTDGSHGSTIVNLWGLTADTQLNGFVLTISTISSTTLTGSCGSACSNFSSAPETGTAIQADNNDHGNSIHAMCAGFYYDNIIFDMAPLGVGVSGILNEPLGACPASAAASYSYNNVFWNLGNETCLQYMDASGFGYTYYTYNDTCIPPGGTIGTTSGDAVRAVNSSGKYAVAIHIINLHLMSAGYSGSISPVNQSATTSGNNDPFYTRDSGNATSIDITTSVAQPATGTNGAVTQGYATSWPDDEHVQTPTGLQPSSGSNASVGQGTNKTSVCSTISALCNALDFTSPSTNGTARPASGAWDVGAYEFNATPQVATPSCTPGSRTYSGSVSVSCTDSTPSSVMCYRTDGVAPTSSPAGTCAAGSSTYSGALTFSANSSLKVLGTLSGDTDSAVASYSFTLIYPARNTMIAGN